MAVETLYRITCDVCGRTKESNDRFSPWYKKMWVRVPDYYHEVGYEYECKEVDICDECLEKAVMDNEPIFIGAAYEYIKRFGKE